MHSVLEKSGKDAGKKNEIYAIIHRSETTNALHASIAFGSTGKSYTMTILYQ